MKRSSKNLGDTAAVAIEVANLPAVTSVLPPEAVPPGVRYAIPKGKGIQRRRAGHGFAYLQPDGQVVKDDDTMNRIRSLVIPPAWTSVWISPSPNGHIQAIGFDARGRKQYRYHPAYRAMRDMVKFHRMREFGKAVERIRRVVARDLARPGLPKRKVLAAIVKLLETTYIRIGNEEYAEANGSFGLTTLRNEHVQILGEVLKFRFRGKSGQSHEIKLEDARLARVVRKCKCMPGSAVFQYLDADGKPVEVESGDVNEYLKDISKGDFTAKDFRTWGGTCLAANYLLEKQPVDGEKDVKAVLVDVVKEVASKLGNKPATCRKYYIHPMILEYYSAGQLAELAREFRKGESSYQYEKLVLSLLTPKKRRAAA